MVVSRSLLKRVVAVGVVLLVVVGGSVGYVGYQYQSSPPSVKSVQSEWGTVTDEQTQIETTVVVNNPNSIGLPGVIGLQYQTTMNGVVIMEGSKSSVGLSPGRNEITIPATMNNTAIARWWVTHVNNDEKSQMTVTASVQAPGGVDRPITQRQTTFETNMLDTLQTSGTRTITLRGETFVVLKDQTASWGEANMQRTPLEFSATLENRHDFPLTLDGLGYTVQMNNVTVGQGQRTENVSIAPGETGTIDVTAVIQTRKMADWWASHVRNNESTRMTVEMYGLVRRDGELERVPFELFSENLRFKTNMLEGGGTSIQPISGGSTGGPSYESPTLISASQEWGEVTQSTSQLRASATLRNPNNGSINQFITFGTRTKATVNGVTVVNETENVGTLDPGRDTLTTTAAWNNDATPRWWARHINNGEESTQRFTQTTFADLGFTKFAVRESGGNATLQTNLLGGIESDQTVNITTESGQKLAELHSTEATWGQATRQTSPFTVTVEIENTFNTDITLKDLQYTITMNDVTVGQGTAPESYTIAPGQTRTIEFSLAINSQKMDEWWASHIRNGERTTVDFQTSVLVETPLGSERTSVDSLTQTRNVTTDILGQDDG